jgi:hypothetical protein
MRYCEIQDVQALRTNHPITPSSKPSTNDVQTIIENLTSRVNGRLSSAGYIVPITGPASLEYLRSMVAFGAAGIIQDSQAAGIAPELHGVNVENRYWNTFEVMLEESVSVDGVLSDAPRGQGESSAGANGRPLPESFFTRYPDANPDSGQFGRLSGTAVNRFQIGKQY